MTDQTGHDQTQSGHTPQELAEWCREQAAALEAIGGHHLYGDSGKYTALAALCEQRVADAELAANLRLLMDRASRELDEQGKPLLMTWASLGKHGYEAADRLEGKA